jgi:protein SCO1/2
MVLVRSRSLVLLVVLLLLVAACGSDPTEAGEHDAAGLTWRGTVLDAPQPKPDFTLTDTSGQPYDLRAQTDGKLTLLFFGYTHCPDACPLQMATIAASLERSTGAIKDDTDVVFVTTDPGRDDEKALRKFLDGFNSRFVGLTGTPDQLVAAQQAAGVALAGTEPPDDKGHYLVGHATQILAFTPDGYAHVVYPAGIRQGDWDHDLPQLFRVGAWQVAT